MTRIKMIGLAVVAVFAVAVVAAATASAKNPVLVTAGGTAVTNLSVTSKNVGAGEPTLQEAGGGKVNCKGGESDKGTVTSTLEGEGMTSGTATVTFKECESAAGKCANTATAGEITGTVSTLLVWVGKESSKTIGILVSILPYTGAGRGKNALLSFKCGTAKILTDVEGSFIATTNKKIGEAGLTSKLIATQAGGAQTHKAYTENKVEGSNNLFSSTGGAAFEESAEEIESEETYTTSVKIIEA
jgi:hypothetical protein